MFSSSVTQFLTLALVGLAAATPVQLKPRSQQVIVGYRKVSSSQAARYNSAGTLTDDGNLIGTQIGSGVYTAHARDLWPGNAGDWTCVITMDSDALDRVSKAWIPQTFGGQKLWDTGDDTINNWIRGVLDDSWDPAKTLRLSIINGMGYNDVQMVVPPGLLNSNGGALGITASCKENKDDIPNVDVNYDDWQNNIKGWRTDPIGS
ncbi:hypothetical protein F5Y19DRAFT_24382 [Xylariaceae sp. FL1651]|nr:hypothetical protein F5Y19DRAFT_24382 [Xylariaceae sp. FL1651]